MRASIVIRLCNEEKLIARLLEGIARQSEEDIEVILADSGSTDHTLEIASHYPVKVIQIQPEEFTFGLSLNRGVSAAQGELLGMATDHVSPVSPAWLSCLFSPF